MKRMIVVPVKGGPDQKSRLAGRLTPASRSSLCSQLAARAIKRAAAVVGVENVHVLSPAQELAGDAVWRKDLGRGLNNELSAFRRDNPGALFVVVNADLAFLEAEDISLLVFAGEAGRLAIAPDRRQTGTNAIAAPPGASFAFNFGDGSFIRHLEQARPREAVIFRRGLAFDIDTPPDLDAALAEGFCMETGPA
ncbi:MAG: 2-phospho-L-lactate guanylyltransferase [Pseudomonadota bacterium]|nr:2-phospho-L-lactate guanylyltransferase [Pseudomonadota bacterium]